MCAALFLSWETLIRSTLTANITTNQGDSKMTVDEKKMFIHPQHSHQRISPKCMYLRSHLSVGFFFPDTVCVCCHMNTAQAAVCEVTDSFIMACTHSETAPSRERREEERPGLLLGQPMSIQWSLGGRRGAAISFNEPSVLSSAFNLQGCPALLHPIHTHKPSCVLQVIPKSSL